MDSAKFRVKPVRELAEIEKPSNTGLWVTIIILNLFIFVLIYVNAKTSLDYSGCLVDRLNQLNASVQSDTTTPDDFMVVPNGTDVQIN